MRDWVLCRLKVGLLLALFFAPVALLQYHQWQLVELEAINYVAPEISLEYVLADVEGDFNLP